MLIFLLLSEKHLVVLFWRVFKYFRNHSELENIKTIKKFVDAGVYLSKE